MRDRPHRSRRSIRIAIWAMASIGSVIAASYGLLPWYVRWAAYAHEQTASVPGDEIIEQAQTGYTLAVTIDAAASEIWPWLVQMGQGRGGFYTHEWVENLLGADIHNAERIDPALQRLAIGDRIRLTPDPYLGQPGQFMTVPRIEHSGR